MNKKLWMEKALELARQGEGYVLHQPYQSILLVSGDDILFSWAEDGKETLDEALNRQSIKQGGILYLPYEPDMIPKLRLWILHSGIIRIEISSLNAFTPNAFVRWAEENKIEVHVGLLKKDGQKLNEVLYHSITSDIPFITLSFGMSLDGKIATVTGDSKYISGNESRVFIHQLRNKHQAILVGINTVKVDHPSLTTRLDQGISRNPDKIILDSNLQIDEAEPLLYQNNLARTIIVTRKESNQAKKTRLKKLKVIIVEVENPSTPMDLYEILTKLKSIGIESILVEGGGTIHFSFIKSKYFNRLYSTISPIIIGGQNAKTAVSGEGFLTLNNAVKLNFDHVFQLGQDYIFEATQKFDNTKENNHA